MKKQVKTAIVIILTVLLFSVAVTLIDAFVHPNYFLKIPIKIVFFLALPLLFFVKNREAFKEFLALFKLRRKGLLKALLLGIGVYAVILGGFFVARNFFDFSRIADSLTNDMGITAENFIYVALYISLMNSFLEEFFFRGYGFITLKKSVPRVAAYIISSTLFAVYHVGMLVGMVNIGLLLLIMAGLFVGGCIFNRLNEENDTIYPSWIVHMFANFAINTVGFILFGVI